MIATTILFYVCMIACFIACYREDGGHRTFLTPMIDWLERRANRR